MAKIAGVDLPDVLLYGVAIYAGYVLLKPAMAASKSAANVLAIPSSFFNQAGEIQPQNIINTARNFGLNFLNFIDLGIPKKLGWY